MTALDIIRRIVRLRDVDSSNIGDGRVLVARPDLSQPSGFVHEYEDQSGGGGGAPSGPAGGVLDGTYPNPGLAAAVAGAGLAETADVLSVNVDDATIEVAADTLRVKDGGITPAKLSFDPATQAELDAHVNDATAAHAASAISYGGGTGMSATDIEAAVDELATEKANTADAVMDGDAAGGVLSGTYPNPGFAADMATQSELDAHAADTTIVHGIADTSALALTANHPSNATFEDHSARHENGGADEISLAGLDGTPSALQTHLDDAADAHDASAISVLDTAANFTGTDVEAVLAELQDNIEAGGGGGAVSFIPSFLIQGG